MIDETKFEQIHKMIQEISGGTLELGLQSATQDAPFDKIKVALNKLAVRLESDHITLEKTQKIEEHLQIITGALASMLEGVAIVRVKDQTLVYANTSFNDMFGYEENELAEKSIRILFAPSERSFEAFTEEVSSTLEKEGSWENKIERIKSNGSQCWTHTKITSFDHEGVGVFWLMLCEDLSEKIKSEKTLHHSESLRRLLIENLPDTSVFLFDHNFRFLIAQGHSLKEQGFVNIEGKVLREVVPQEKAQELEFYYQKILSGEEVRFEKKYKERIYRIHGVPVRNKEGEIEAGLIMSQEITAQVNRDNQLQQTQKMESLGTLAGGIAHEFNNILASIQGYSELLLEQFSEGSEEHEYLTRVVKSSHRAVDLVKQILVFSRMDEDTEIISIKLSALLHESLSLLRSTLPANIEIRVDIEDNCGYVDVNTSQMHQVILNLCTNAFHAMEHQNNGILEVGLRRNPNKVLYLPPAEGQMSKPENYIELWVKDNGCGIPQKHLTHIFDPFFTTKEVGKGTGLGLSVVHGIVLKHKGTISVESSLESGTKFTILLPTVSKLKRDSSKFGMLAAKKRKFHILIVEDEITIMQMYETFLERRGFKVTVTENGQNALKLFQKNPYDYDLVFTDMAMPNMTGKQLARELLGIRADLPVVLATGYSSVISEKEAKTIGIAHFLLKPIQLDHLLEVINLSLNQEA
ncbi:response regulator [Deltaproteobacteria bacterium TL4]